MSGTKKGGKKSAVKNKQTNPDFYRIIGSKGGSVKGTNKGFAAMSPERHSEISRRGGMHWAKKREGVAS
jgi:general stress protein YciG